MLKTLFLHPGLPKTATTTLQNHIFPDNSSFLYLGKHHSKYTPDSQLKDKWLRLFMEDLIVKDRPHFHSLASEFLGILEKRFGNKLLKYDKWLLSEEGIFSRCLRPGKYNRNIVQFGSAYDVMEKIALLSQKNSAFQIRLILTLRRQDNLVHSYFAQVYECYRSIFKIRTMNQYVDFLLGEGVGGPADSVLDYSSLIIHADNLFGRKNVLVLPYEFFLHSPVEFIKELSSFMNIDNINKDKNVFDIYENKRYLANGRKGADINRLNFLIKLKKRLFGHYSSLGIGSTLSPLLNFKKVKPIKFEENDRKRIMHRYGRKNKILNERVPKIVKYGYFG